MESVYQQEKILTRNEVFEIVLNSEEIKEKEKRDATIKRVFDYAPEDGLPWQEC